MVQLAMLVSGIALGLRGRDWRQAVSVILVLFLVVVVLQTIFAVDEDDVVGTGGWLIYIAIQAASLAVGLLIARVLIARRRRRVGAEV